ncbi:hypothetical protein SEA_SETTECANDELA_202 [Mycobacterium phage Settecandela]|nr:hypothetical protein SEA_SETTECANDELA_202 [Mycobacterium phage Settecandela]
MTVTDTHKFLNVTAETIPSDWMRQHDMATELNEMSSLLTVQQWGTVLSAIRTGLPVKMTWDTKLGNEFYTRPIERKTVMVIIKSVHVYDQDSGHIRVQYWGFGHEVFLKNVRFLDAAEAEVEFLTEEDAAR